MNASFKEDSEFEYNLLSDRPLEPDEKERFRFGHSQTIEALTSLARRAEPPFTIGLYGKWGTGKTSVAKAVLNHLHSDEFRTVYFDTWKYERDSLRRQFLIELDKQLFNGSLKYVEELNQSLTKQKVPTWEDVWNFSWRNWVIRILLVATVVTALIWSYSQLTAAENLFSDLFFLLTSTGLLGIFVTFILSSIQYVYGTVQQPRTDSAEGFESYFIEVLKKQELKGKKLLITFDNLDRVENKKAIEILSDIKTFLSVDRDNRNVVFLIPCDDDALRDQLIQIYGEDFDADEFLRKFFNLTVRLPKLIDIDLHNYVNELLKETNISELTDNTDLTSLIVFSLRDNPREVKQFINSLIPAIILAKKRQISPVLSSIAFLAKLLVIRQKYPILYTILEEKSLRGEINLDSTDLLTTYENELRIRNWNEEAITKERERYNSFNDYTKGLNQEHVDVFLTLYQSNEAKSIPEWESYVLASEEGNTEEIEKIFNSIKKEGRLADFDKLLLSRLGRVSSGLQITNLVANTLALLDRKRENLRWFLNTAATHFPFGNDLGNSYELFPPKRVFDYWYPKIELSRRGKLVSATVELLVRSQEERPAIEDGYLTELLELIDEKPEIFRGYQEQIRDSIESHIFVYPYPLYFQNPKARELFLSHVARGKFIDSLNASKIDDTESRKKLFKFWNALNLNKGVIKNSFKKYREFAKAIENTDSDVDKILFAEAIYKFTKDHTEEVKNSVTIPEFASEIEEISSSLALYYEQVGRENKKLLMPAIDLFHSMNGNPQSGNLRTKISDFIETAEGEDLKKITKQQLNNWVEQIPEAFVQRSSRNPDVLLRANLYKKLDENQNQSITLGLISNRVSPLSLLKVLNYEVPNPENVMDQIINDLPQAPTAVYKDYFFILKKFGIKTDTTRIENLKTSLINLRNQNPTDWKEMKKNLEKNKNIFNAGQLSELGIKDESNEI